MVKVINKSIMNVELSDAFYYNENKDICIIIEMNYFTDNVLCWDINLRCGFHVDVADLIPIPIGQLMSIIDTKTEGDIYQYTDTEGNVKEIWELEGEDVLSYDIGVVTFDDAMCIENEGYYDVELNYFHQLQQLNRMAGFEMPMKIEFDDTSILFAKGFVENLHKTNNN